MKLISTGFKGIYLYECKNISNEEYIPFPNIFVNNLGTDFF